MEKCYRVTVPKEEQALAAYVAECDRVFEQELDEVVEQVAATKGLRMLGLTGPTCSGKTTAAKKLTQCLESHGRRVHVISIDDFYYETDYLRKRPGIAADVKIDFDSEDTIDAALLEKNAERLLSGLPTKMPRFNFRTGQREDGLTIDPSPDDVFLFEGIQVLYPKVRKILCKDASYRCIYISPEYGIEIEGEVFEPNEIRLMRRLVRDQLYRASNATFTFFLWDSVRVNEEKSIFPNQNTCHHFINSTMPYEIGMLKPYLESMLPTVAREDEHWETAQKLLKKMEHIAPVSSNYISENSLYKEFI